MVKEDILGGLELAASKGVSLKQAMISFYKAGYSQKDIKEAAGELQKKQQSSGQNFQNTPNFQGQRMQQKPGMQTASAKGLPKKMSLQSNNQNQGNQGNIPQGNSETSLPGNTQSKKVPAENEKTEQNPQKTKKRTGVSDYSEKKPDSKKYFIILYVFISVLIFIGVLTLLFVFKEQIIEFFKKILASF